ncbi:hypothetical protein SEPCBS57363_003839 [Sporothrix epigloea]|uniref:C2H2-type domain-containing protein n=1 Tax=Sporothrix epigloea TaxID=1892477 RepID=A0ABP0DNQ8_9PEZI
MPARTRTASSGATSARSTPTVYSDKSAGSTPTNKSTSTQPSSVSAAASTSASANASYNASPADSEVVPLVPTTTPVNMTSTTGTLSPLDALYAPMATAVNLVHMEQMAQYLQAPETQQSLDTLLAAVKVREMASEDIDGNGVDEDVPDYHTVLDELDYLEGLFKKLRFSYKEQLTKETVVRRILELELPLLSATDIDRIVQSTELERQQWRQTKSEGREQGAAAERLMRDLAAERLYVMKAEKESAQLPDRILRLRHRLARMKLALRAELDAIDRVSSGAGDTRAEPAISTTSHLCAKCGRSFYSEAFHELHQAMHTVQDNKGSIQDGQQTFDLADFGDGMAAADVISAAAMRRCNGCSQMVPVLFLDSTLSKGESHSAFHARIQKANAEAQQKLAATTAPSAPNAPFAAHAMLGDLDMSLHGETEETIRQLRRSEADLAALEKRMRSEAERQAAIEGEMTQSLQHLRESVSSIRLEMLRIEQEADRMVQYMEEGRTNLGRSLQEQTDLFDVLLLTNNDDDADDDDDDDDGNDACEDAEMQD